MWRLLEIPSLRCKDDMALITAPALAGIFLGWVNDSFVVAEWRCRHAAGTAAVDCAAAFASQRR
jgi:hypothetical protein